MTSVTVELTPETEQRLRLQASRRGETLETFLRLLAEKEANGEANAPDVLSQGLDWLTHRRRRGSALRDVSSWNVSSGA